MLGGWKQTWESDYSALQSYKEDRIKVKGEKHYFFHEIKYPDSFCLEYQEVNQQRILSSAFKKDTRNVEDRIQRMIYFLY